MGAKGESLTAMPRFTAIYHPSWDPPAEWLRMTLLLYDQIKVIQPVEVHNPEYCIENQELFAAIPGAFDPIRKRHYELGLSTKNMTLFDEILGQIVPPRRRSSRRIRLEIGTDGGMSVPGYTFLHVSKMPSNILAALKARSLIHEEAERFLRHSHNISGFRIVETRSANLILALIAEHYARPLGLRTLTNDNAGYVAVAFSRQSVKRRDAAATRLASLVMRMQMPTGLATLSAKQFVDLRKRYEDVREPFHHAMRTLCDDRNLSTITDRKQFDEMANAAARSFSDKIDAMVKQKWSSKLRNWAPVGFGIVSTCVKLTSPIGAAVGASIDVLLKLKDVFKSPLPMTETRAAQHVLAMLQSELEHPLLLRRISR